MKRSKKGNVTHNKKNYAKKNKNLCISKHVFIFKKANNIKNDKIIDTELLQIKYYYKSVYVTVS